VKWYSQWKLASFAIIPSLSCVQYFQHIYILDTHNGDTTNANNCKVLEISCWLHGVSIQEKKTKLACSIAQCRGAQFSLSKLTADCAAKSVEPASSISIHSHYYNCNHYCVDRQGVNYVDTNIPDKGSPAKFLCSVIILRGVGPGGLWCVCVVFVRVCVWPLCVCLQLVHERNVRACICVCVYVWHAYGRV